MTTTTTTSPYARRYGNYSSPTSENPGLVLSTPITGAIAGLEDINFENEVDQVDPPDSDAEQGAEMLMSLSPVARGKVHATRKREK